MDDATLDDKKVSLEDLIKSGKNIGDEMDPDVNMDDSVDEKISLNVIVEEEKTLQNLKDNIVVEEKKIELKNSDSKKSGILGYILIAIFVSAVSILVSWFIIF